MIFKNEITMCPIRTDPEGLNRVRVQFVWQLGTQSKSPWIRVLSAHGGAGKGFHILPEIGEEVLVGFVGGNGENPYVIGSFYNGKQKSGFATENNDLKVIKTRSGHQIILDDSENKMSINILDKSGNRIYFDTMNKNILIEAPETIDIICKNLNINVKENINTTAGQNITETARMNKIQNVGMNYFKTITGNANHFITGKLSEIIEGDVHSETKQERNELSNDSLNIVTNSELNSYSKNEVNLNSKENGKNN